VTYRLFFLFQFHNKALKQSVQTLEENVSTLSQSLESVQASLANKEQEVSCFFT
jgi:uncharacterized protein YukE